MPAVGGTLKETASGCPCKGKEAVAVDAPLVFKALKMPAVMFVDPVYVSVPSR